MQPVAQLTDVVEFHLESERKRDITKSLETSQMIDEFPQSASQLTALVYADNPPTDWLDSTGSFPKNKQAFKYVLWGQA